MRSKLGKRLVTLTAKGRRVAHSPIHGLLAIPQQRWFPGLLLILPGAVVVVGLVGYPLFYAVRLSLFDLYLIEGVESATWTGLGNFIEIFHDPATKVYVVNTLKYVISSLIAQFVVGLGVALLLNADLRFRGVMRAIALIPWVMPTVVATLVWRWILDGQWGILNYIMLNLGLINQPINWLANKDVIWWSVIAVSLWRHFPFWYVNLLAGLQVIPEELYECAKIDGASWFHQFWYITIPHLRPVIVVLFLLQTIWRTNDFTTVWTLTRGGPGSDTMVLATAVYEQSFVFYHMGYASAIAVLTMTAMMGFTIFYLGRVLSSE
jgi:multiple sugar transport system permease protein